MSLLLRRGYAMGGETILVADDDRVILLTLAEGLESAGYHVVTAKDGLQALASCKRDHPDLAILDIRMPGLDGIALAKKMLRETAVPIVFLSAYDDEPLVKDAVDAGALGYLVKPLGLPSIVRSVQVALARAKELADLIEREDKLTGALESNRIIATAVGMVMREHGLDQNEAFERLRRTARSRRSKLEDLANAIVEKGEHID